MGQVALEIPEQAGLLVLSRLLARTHPASPLVSLEVAYNVCQCVSSRVALVFLLEAQSVKLSDGCRCSATFLFKGESSAGEKTNKGDFCFSTALLITRWALPPVPCFTTRLCIRTDVAKVGGRSGVKCTCTCAVAMCRRGYEYEDFERWVFEKARDQNYFLRSQKKTMTNVLFGQI